MKAIEEFIEALKIGETLKERLQTVKQEQGAGWEGSEDYADAISYVGELMEVAAIKMLAKVYLDDWTTMAEIQEDFKGKVEAAEHQKENAMHQLRLIGIVQTIEDI
jgi:hypothetical protein